MARASGSPKRSGPNSPNGPSPVIGSTLVAGSTSPGSVSEIDPRTFWTLTAIEPGSTQRGGGCSSGSTTVTPHGTPRSPFAASAFSSSIVMVGLRFRSPVTTASGNRLGTSVSTGLVVWGTDDDVGVVG